MRRTLSSVSRTTMSSTTITANLEDMFREILGQNVHIQPVDVHVAEFTGASIAVGAHSETVGLTSEDSGKESLFAIGMRRPPPRATECVSRNHAAAPREVRRLF